MYGISLNSIKIMFIELDAETKFHLSLPYLQYFQTFQT